MSHLAKLRQWINRDDGRLYQAVNRSLGMIETVGLLIFVSAIVLWQIHVKTGVSIIWPLAAGSIGLVLAIVGAGRKIVARIPNQPSKQTALPPLNSSVRRRKPTSR
jgi:hypothetical protein